jgi:hypothetical protein
MLRNDSLRLPLTFVSVWRLRWDLAWARGLLWMARSGQGGRQPRREVHLFLADRYGRLAEHFQAEGAFADAVRWKRKFDFHYRAAGGSGGPPSGGPRYDGAMAMPRPRPLPETPLEDAVANAASEGADGPDDAA